MPTANEEKDREKRVVVQGWFKVDAAMETRFIKADFENLNTSGAVLCCACPRFVFFLSDFDFCSNFVLSTGNRISFFASSFIEMFSLVQFKIQIGLDWVLILI